MAVGTIETSILTNIANAIRYKAGVATLYKPREMAAAVSALDGTDAGNYQAQPYMALESGVLPESVFEDIADAIRGQNGLSTLYQPGDMAAAILALEWDVGYKVRALLLDDGTLEFNYYDRRRTVYGGTIQQAFEVDTSGYSSASARSWDSVKLLVRRVYIDSSIAGLGITNCAYWFNSFAECTEVRGFENLSGITNATQMFTSCGKLETIYATSFTNAITSSGSMFYGCSRLVGGTDGYVPTSTSAGSVCKLGTGGVLTNPNADSRTWLRALLRGRAGRAHGHRDAGRHARASGHGADLCHRQVHGHGLHALGQHEPPAAHERALRERHGLLRRPEPDLPVLQLHEPGDRHGPRQPGERILDALHVQLLRGDGAGLPGVRPVHADGPVLLLLWMQLAHDDLRGQHVGAAELWHQRHAVLLQLPLACRRQRDRMV